jgi:hypothetical protein
MEKAVYKHWQSIRTRLKFLIWLKGFNLQSTYEKCQKQQNQLNMCYQSLPEPQGEYRYGKPCKNSQATFTGNILFAQGTNHFRFYTINNQKRTPKSHQALKEGIG